MPHTDDFHDAALKPAYTYRRNPHFEKSFLIFRKRGGADMVPYATYTTLDSHEDPVLSERKVMNLVSILNGRRKLLDLGSGTGTRTLHHAPAHQNSEEGRKVVFYTLRPEGVSQENAILVFDPGAEILSQEGAQGHG